MPHFDLVTPPGFSFQHTVQSHGWCVLEPFTYDDTQRVLRRVLVLPDSGAVACEIEPGPGTSVRVRCRANRLTREDGEGLRGQVRRMLRLDLDLGEFHALVATDSNLAWAAAAGAGRLLRAPSLFEDLVKLLCTTNCAWSQTRRMVQALVGLGLEAPGGGRAFPSPEVLADAPPRFFRDTARAGYRGLYLRELARRVSAGDLDLESWEGDTSEEIRGRVLALRGMGPYVADQMLRLLGHFEGLGLDSWCRAQYALRYHHGRRVSDRTIARRYARFGRYRGLALWCDLTRDWFRAPAQGSTADWARVASTGSRFRQVRAETASEAISDTGSRSVLRRRGS